ncbi:hypothetical protein NDU88_003607 [Pleurodeles waltl]|uniref:Uncharacterized protein n=1 Tax=Pleurodeles waltl TaxID=8319 RepID=A0AAV7MUS7_PLEWA|nr:hypothetical protein NDU88_003607 [Pleurodeles waltl]
MSSDQQVNAQAALPPQRLMPAHAIGGTFNLLPPFSELSDPATATFCCHTWAVRLNNYFKATKEADGEPKHSLLLHYAGGEIFKLTSTCTEDDPQKEVYTQISQGREGEAKP